MLSRLSAWFRAKSHTMDTQEVRLPPDLPHWSTVKELLQDLHERLTHKSLTDQETGWFMQTIYNTIQSERRLNGTRESQLSALRQQIQSDRRKKLDQSCLWFGMLKYLGTVSVEEKEKFLFSTLPHIIELALAVEECPPRTSFYKSRQQHGGSTSLSRKFVSSIVACFFLCVFPERKGESTNMNMVNFTTFFKHLPNPSQVAKLRCLLHYFECIVERGMHIPGKIIFCRKVASLDWLLTFDELVSCDLQLCPLHIHHHGTIEDSGAHTIQVCFGNKSVGGGVLGRSAVQEEILFSVCPELLAAMLFMESMEPNESIIISGFEQFSSCSGFGDSLQFAGHYGGTNKTHTMVTIDAASYRETSLNKQYEESSVLRDLNKALIGFSWMPGTDSGVMQPWEVGAGEAETNGISSGMTGTSGGNTGTVEAAADIVTSAMTHALEQASESQPPSCHQPQSQLHHQPHHHHEPHHHHQAQLHHQPHRHRQPQPHQLPQKPPSLSCHQQQASSHVPEMNSVRTAHIGTAQDVEQLSLPTDSPAECFNHEQNLSDSAALYSGTLQTTQSLFCSPDKSSTSSSSSFSLNVHIPIDNSVVPKPFLPVHSIAEPALGPPAQSMDHLSDKYHNQLLELTSQELSTCSSTQVQFSLTDRAYPCDNNLASAAESSALTKVSQASLSGPAHIDSGRHLVSDILGNLSRAGPTDTADSWSERGESFIELPKKQHKLETDVVLDFSVALKDNKAETSQIIYSTAEISPFKGGKDKLNCDRPSLSQNVKKLTGNICTDLVNSIDLVLSLPELERVSSGLSSSSLAVNVDSQSLSEEQVKRPAGDVMRISVENSDSSHGAWRYNREMFVSGTSASSNDSKLQEPSFSSSPQSSVSSANISPNTSFLVPESFHQESSNGSSDVHITGDLFLPGLEGLCSQAQQFCRTGSRDFYGELKDFLHSSSSGSRSSGSGGPPSSSNSSWGSRSGSISSHGTNGSTIDFPDFWSHFRRRSSQLSDATSRRSSSSKHSSDFSTDLEEITGGAHKHDHGVIEEESSFLSLVADFAAHIVSHAVRKGVIMGAQLASSKSGSREVELMGTSTTPGSSLKEQLSVDVELMESIYDKSSILRTARANTERSLLTSSYQAGSGRHQMLDSKEQLSPLLAQKSPRGLEPPSCTTSSVLSPASKLASIPRPYITTALLSPAISQHQKRIKMLEDHPLSSHSLDSGFSSAMPSVTFITESQADKTIFNSSVTRLEGSLPTNVAVHSLSPETLRPENVSDTSLSKKLNLKIDLSESAEAQDIISCSPVYDKTLYATLQSKTIYLCPRDDQEITSVMKKENVMEEIQLEPSSCEMNVALVSVSSRHHQKTESALMEEPMQPYCSCSEIKSKLPQRFSSVSTAELRTRKQKFHRKQKVEETPVGSGTHSRRDHKLVSENSTGPDTASNGLSHVVPPSAGAAFASSKSSGIPKLRGCIKRLSTESEISGNKSKSTRKPVSLSMKSKQKISEGEIQRNCVSSTHGGTTTEKKLSRSRYVFSDVAAPVIGKLKKSKAAILEDCNKKHNEKRRKQKGDHSRHDQFTLKSSPKFICFVNSIAEMSVSQAVLEGAEILAQSSGRQDKISDELYNWFATKIVTEVFLHVVNEMDSQPRGTGDPVPDHDDKCCPKEQPSLTTSKSDTNRAEAVVPKPKSILPGRSDSQATASKGLEQIKQPGSLKMVKFKESRGEGDSSLAKTISTFYKQSSGSTIPVPTRWRSSLDMHSSSYVAHSSSKSSLKPTHQSQVCVSRHASLTSRDLSIDIYQAAANIVSQVFQTISDSLAAQTPSPVSSGRHGTVSSSDTALHSTGSRIHGSFESIASNIFSNSSAPISDSSKRTWRSVSPSIGVFTRKPMSRETLTNAFLKVEGTPSIKCYERRSSEPCQTSVQLSLQAFNSIKFSKQAVEDKQRKVSKTDDDIGRGQTWRRGSLDGFSFERRNSCGFKDPVLSRFAEELMKADTSVPELVIVGSHPGSSSTGSRRSSVSVYKEAGLTNLETELLNTSFTSVCSLPVSHSSRSQGRWADRSGSRDSRHWKSDSSDTEYWFPPPKIVGDEFQQEYNRQHSQEELQDYASFFAGRVVQEAVCVLRCDPAYMSREEQGVQLFAENLMDQIMRDAMIASVDADRTRCGRGDYENVSSTHPVGPVSTNDSGDSLQRAYHLEGARPKTAYTSVGARSKIKTISHRRDIRGRDYLRTGDSNIRRHGNRYKERRASATGDNERLASESQRCLYASSHPTATAMEGSRQDCYVSQSVKKKTADFRPSPSRHKRHSGPNSSLPNLSLLPTFSVSASTLHTQSMSSHRDPKIALRARSERESATSAAEDISVYAGSVSREFYQLKEETCASSVSSCQSEQTESSFPSSSGSESIGPSGRESPVSKQRVKRELESRGAASNQIKLALDRSRKRDVHTRKLKWHSNKDKITGQVRETCPVIEHFASTLSCAILEAALLHSRDNRWLRFLSYHKAIATGNWGCGAFRGNAQLKFIIQWIAASVSRAPLLMYYTFGDSRLEQAPEVVDLVSGLTVGQLAVALRDYCHLVYLKLASSTSFFSSSRPHFHHHHVLEQTETQLLAWKADHDYLLPQTLFDFLKEKFRMPGREDNVVKS